MSDTKIINKKEKALNRHWKNYIAKNYIGACNLETGEEMLLTIAKFVGDETVKGTNGKEEEKIVLYFKEDVPKLILNITNANTISSLYGSHPDQWIGKQIQLFRTKGDFFGKKNQDAIRIRDFAPNPAVAVTEFKNKLEIATTIAELGTAWKALPVSAKNNKEVVAIKDSLKAKLTA